MSKINPISFEGRVIVDKKAAAKQLVKLDDTYKDTVINNINRAVQTVEQNTPDDRVYDLEIYVGNDSITNKKDGSKKEVQYFYYIFSDLIEYPKNAKRAYAHSEAIEIQHSTQEDVIICKTKHNEREISAECEKNTAKIVEKLNSIAAKSEYSNQYSENDDIQSIIEKLN